MHSVLYGRESTVGALVMAGLVGELEQGQKTFRIRWAGAWGWSIGDGGFKGFSNLDAVR